MIRASMFRPVAKLVPKQRYGQHITRYSTSSSRKDDNDPEIFLGTFAGFVLGSLAGAELGMMIPTTSENKTFPGKAAARIEAIIGSTVCGSVIGASTGYLASKYSGSAAIISLFVLYGFAKEFEDTNKCTSPSEDDHNTNGSKWSPSSR